MLGLERYIGYYVYATRFCELECDSLNSRALSCMHAHIVNSHFVISTERIQYRTITYAQLGTNIEHMKKIPWPLLALVLLGENVQWLN